MKIKKLYIIVNPVSGEKRPVLRLLTEAFADAPFAWEVSITKKAGDEELLAKKAAQSNADAVAVYGGDGTLSKVVGILYKTKKPLIVIPGGSANVFAETVGMPLDINEALGLIAKQNLFATKIDMALVNNQPLLVSITTGLIAKTVLKTSRDLKGTFGKFAYLLRSMSILYKTKPTRFLLTVDGKHHKVSAIALVVANTGKFFFAGVPVMKQLSYTDGMVDILAVKRGNIFSMAKMAVMYMLKEEMHPNIKVWKGKKVQINTSKHEAILIDDVPEKDQNEFTITVDPLSIHFLLPRVKES